MPQKSYKKVHLTGKQLKGVQALLTADTVEKAAEKVGVTRNTLYRWLKEDLFVRELNQAKRQVVRLGIIKLQRATDSAVKTLLEICKNKKATDSARVSAAREILNNTLKSIELEEIEERIAALEEKHRKGKPIGR